jgi:hypothetical protein
VSDIINNFVIFCQIDALDSTAENTVNIEVAQFSENEVVVEISPEKTEKKENYAGNEEDNDKDDESETNNAESTVDVASCQHCTNTSIDTEEAAEPVSQFVHTASHKYRSLSESSGIELVSTLSRIRQGFNFLAYLLSCIHFLTVICMTKCMKNYEKVLIFGNKLFC